MPLFKIEYDLWKTIVHLREAVGGKKTKRIEQCRRYWDNAFYQNENDQNKIRDKETIRGLLFKIKGHLNRANQTKPIYDNIEERILAWQICLEIEEEIKRWNDAPIQTILGNLRHFILSVNEDGKWEWEAEETSDLLRNPPEPQVE